MAASSSDPFFWPEDLWIPQPSDWSRNIVRGKTYDLAKPIGAALWEQVRLRLEGLPSPDPRPLILPGGYDDPVPMRHRIGQGTFRVVITDTYRRQCAVTRDRALPALEAAHIRPFADTETHYVRNGLLLRSDVHRLFDAGYLTVTPEHQVEASHRMREDFNDGENYMRLHGAPVWVPDDSAFRPDPKMLRWHNENRFRG